MLRRLDVAVLWLAGATALPSVGGTARSHGLAMPTLCLMTGCFVLQVVLFFALVVSDKARPGAPLASRKRVAWLLALLGLVLALSVAFAVAL